ncbi:MAG TPA: PilZ domain-containing protein [Spirochaetota bacterium]|nr:PilZ domain-containing protein [Spirochaetota bacterium]
MVSERRKHPRFGISQLVEVDLGQEKYINAEGINLSRNGVLCKTEDECPLYSRVLLMVTLPYKNEERIVNMEGIVSRSVHKGKGWETGINITSINKAGRTVFDEVMDNFHS